MRMTATILREAIELGNSGAQLLATGSTVDAMLVMRRAMQLLQEENPRTISTNTTTAMLAPMPTSNNQSSNYGGCGVPTSPDALLVPFSLCGPHNNDNSPSCGFQDTDSIGSTLQQDRRPNVCYRYRRPMTIPCDVLQILSHPSQHHPELLDTVLYTVSSCLVMNMALACHEMALVTGEDAPLRHAQELYVNLLYNSCYNTNNTVVHTTNTLLQCLAVNNLICLHYERCDYEACQWYLKCLEDLLCRSPSCFLSKQLSQYDIEEIHLNLVFVRPPVAAQAA